MSQQVQAQAFDEFAHAAEVAYREAEEKDATLCSVCRCQQVAIDAPAASNLFAVSRNLETLTHDRDELRRQNEQLAHQLDEMQLKQWGERVIDDGFFNDREIMEQV